jgi:hypothetical protein
MRAGAPFPLSALYGVRVTEMNGEIIVANDDFRAVYYKPDKLDPQLVLRRRTAVGTRASAFETTKRSFARLLFGLTVRTATNVP